MGDQLTASAVRSATIGQRFAALLLDWLIITAAYFVGILVLILGIWTETLIGTLLGVLVFILLGFVFALYNYWFRVGQLGSSLGKAAIGIQVTDVGSTERIGLGRAFIRGLLSLLSFTALFMEGQRGVHDLAARSRVVQHSTLAAQSGPSSASPTKAMEVVSIGFLVLAVICALTIGLLDDSAVQALVLAAMTILALAAGALNGRVQLLRD